MNLTRHLAEMPSRYNLGQLQTEGSAVAVNIVDGQVAGYWVTGTQPTLEQWEQIVAAHVPAAEPEPDPAPVSLEVLAEQAAQDAYDEVINAGSLSMSRINAANKAASEARLAVLQGV